MASDTEAVQKAGGWVVAWGVLLIIAGFLAVMMPAAAALATTLVLGWVLIFAGGFEIVHAIQTRAQDGFILELLSAILTLVLGVWLLVSPIAAAASLALLIGAFLFASGVARTMHAFQWKPRNGWGWILFDGLLSIVLAILIAMRWPASSLDFIGLLTGFTLISTGVWRIVLGRALRSGAATAATK